MSDPFGSDLNEFVKKLRPEDFRIAGKPLALGTFERRVKEVKQQGALPVHPMESQPAESQRFSKHHTERSQAVRRFSFLRFFIIHMFDLCIVVGSFSIMLVSVGHYLAPNEGSPLLARLMGWEPILKIMNLNLIQATLVLYGVYLVYFVFFKLLAHQTLGESLVEKN